METTQFYLPKKTGTYADALAAMGLGHLVYLLSAEHPTIRDEGAFFVIERKEGKYDLDDFAYDTVHDAPGYEYVRLKPEDKEGPIGVPVVEYTEERERLQAYRKQRDLLAKSHGGRPTAEDEEALKGIAPRKGWYLYQNINVLQGFNSYNSLHTAIRNSDRTVFAMTMRHKLAALAENREPITTAKDFAAKDFAPKVAAVQAFNPAVGKGINRPKPDGPVLGGLPSAFVDWFEEWLRYIGIHLSANALSVGDDIKLFVMAPANLDEAQAQAIRDDFVSLRLPWSPRQIDILGALGLVRVLIDRSGISGADDEMLALFSDATPSDVIAGLQTAYFTSLGSAKSLTNLSFVGLPGWFRISDVDTWLAVLSEHERVIRALDESHSEDASLLVSYRDFLSAGEQGLSPLLSFLAQYAPHIMRARDQKKNAPQFTTTNLGRLLLSMDEKKGTLQSILDNDGFKNIAGAIRRATVSEQFIKARTGQQTYEIHYGLFQDLERKARFQDQFVAALSAFITDYNTENARIAERRARSERGGTGNTAGRRRPQITDKDVKDVMLLIDRHDSEPVAMLLLAYGSAREARDPDTTQDAASEDLSTDVVDNDD